MAVCEGGDFARHAEVAPEIGAMREAFVVDFDDPIGMEIGQGLAGFDVLEFEQAGVIAIDAELGGTGEHAFAFDAFLQRSGKSHVAVYGAGWKPNGQHASPSIRSATHDGSVS